MIKKDKKINLVEKSKRLIKEISTYDRMNNNVISNALIVMICFFGIILIALICILFNV